MSVVVTRDSLGLADLQINDFINYYVGSEFLGAGVTWNRNQVSSPFLDGQVTTFRNRQNVSEPATVEVLADEPNLLQIAQNTLVQAFLQDFFNVLIVIGTGTHKATYQIQCEAADYTVAWTGPRWLATQGQVKFTVPCQPVPIVGGAF